jgi:gentisate 1,2-dioxygenase
MASPRAATAKPTWVEDTRSHSPLMVYAWSRIWAALCALRDQPADPHDGLSMEYTDPLTGGRVIPTMSCVIQLLPPAGGCEEHAYVLRTGTS